MSLFIYLFDFDIKKLNLFSFRSGKAHADLIDDLDSKENDLRQARLQIELLKSTKTQYEQAQDQNQRLLQEKQTFVFS